MQTKMQVKTLCILETKILCQTFFFIKFKFLTVPIQKFQLYVQWPLIRGCPGVNTWIVQTETNFVTGAYLRT